MFHLKRDNSELLFTGSPTPSKKTFNFLILNNFIARVNIMLIDFLDILLFLLFIILIICSFCFKYIRTKEKMSK